MHWTRPQFDGFQFNCLGLCGRLHWLDLLSVHSGHVSNSRTGPGLMQWLLIATSRHICCSSSQPSVGHLSLASMKAKEDTQCQETLTKQSESCTCIHETFDIELSVC